MQHSKIRSDINYCFLGTEAVLRTTDHEMIPVVLGWRSRVWCGAGGRLATGTTTRLLQVGAPDCSTTAVWKRQAFRVAWPNATRMSSRNSSFAKNILRMRIYPIPSRNHLLACGQYYIQLERNNETNETLELHAVHRTRTVPHVTGTADHQNSET
jgi:hypothetical protein